MKFLLEPVDRAGLRPGDLGEICSYTWNEEKNGWDFNASCMTCGMGWSDFIPYKE